MSSLGTTRGLLEIAKFAVFVIVPVGVLYTIASNSKNPHRLSPQHSYVAHPSERTRPSSPEEIQEMIRYKKNKMQ